MSRSKYTLLDLTELAFHWFLRLLPTELVSTIGAVLATVECRRQHWLGSEWPRVACSNITRLTGETDQKVLRRRLFRNAENTGRLRAEYSILGRLTNSDRIAFEGLENITGSSRPIIFITAHLSNWEVLFPAMMAQGISMSPMYDPPLERGRRQIVHNVRMAFARLQPGQEMISTTGNTMRHCVKTLEKGRNLLIFVDEERGGLIWCPHLGRTLPNEGNRFFVARLANRFGAAVIPVRISRVSGFKFVCSYMPALPMPSTGNRDADTKALADTITEQVEEWVKNDLDQWFWLPQLNLDRKFPSQKQARRKQKQGVSQV